MEEQNIEDTNLAEQDIETFLKNNGLLATTSFMKPYVRVLILEFYANLQLSIIDSRRKLYQKVYGKSRWYEFNQELIQKVLKCFNRNMVELDKSLDATTIDIINNIFQYWLKKESIRDSLLFIIYVALFAIETRNWVLNTQRDSMILLTLQNSNIVKITKKYERTIPKLKLSLNWLEENVVDIEDVSNLVVVISFSFELIFDLAL
ncbi:hypothetical protein PVK06_011011 [Gossypium arboreum]|uniref:Uncharacterized protein n=1 Tax=Gossypium arboreum TaxID=29729 RepID=A0ABR0Q8K9_GOSAR|nr:hypothetical protein PVK06_011011 [Gossypium arboreum]